MAIQVPPIGTVTTLWQQRSINAVGEYKSGIQGAGQTWQSAVDNAETLWVAGVNQAASSDAYPRGVAGKASKYVDRGINIGSTRYGPGVQAATTAYQNGMGKVLAEIAGITLPPRGPAGMNAGRQTAIPDMLHQAKMAGRLS